MAIAYNQQTGEALYSEGSEWKPAKIAMNPKTGERVAFDGKAWQPLQSKPLPAKTDDGLTTGSKFADKTLNVLGGPTYATNEAIYHGKETGDILKQGVKDIPGDLVNREKQDWQGVKDAFKESGTADTALGGLYGAGKTALRAAGMPFEVLNVPLENTYGRLASKGAKNLGMDASPEEMSILPEVAMPGGVGKKVVPDIEGTLSLLKTPKATEEINKLFEGLGITRQELKAANTPDKLRDLIAAKKATKSAEVTGAMGGTPIKNEQNLTDQMGEAVAKANINSKSEEAALHGAAKQTGEHISLAELDPETLDAVHGVLSQYGRDELALRRALHNEKTKGLSVEDLSERDKLQIKLDEARLTAAEQKFDATGLPRNPRTARDLIAIKQFLNAENVANMTGAELKVLQHNKDIIDQALKELEKVNPDLSTLYGEGGLGGKGPLSGQPFSPDTKLPDFAGERKAANTATEMGKLTIESSQAKKLGISEDFMAAAKKKLRESADPRVKEAARVEMANHMRGALNQVTTPADVDYLASLLKDNPKMFSDLMATKADKLMEASLKSPQTLEENKELLLHMADKAGVKGKAAKDALEKLQNFFDYTKKQKIDLNFPDAIYRSKNPGYLKRLWYATKGAVLTVFGHKIGGIHALGSAVSPAEEALSAERLNIMRKTGLKKPINVPVNIPGEAIGATLGGNAAYQDQK